jgi:3',5'-cyclic AMP phosphodiesterase CpdA
MLATTFAPWAVSDGAQANKATYPYLRVRGEIAIIGLSSAVPTAPLMATGRLGKKQIEAFAELLRQTGAKGLARVVLIHHPPLAGAPPLRGLSDAVAFERVVRDFGAEAILHGHIHRQAVRSLPSRAARTVSGAVPVLSAPSAAAAASHPRYRAAYHLVRLDREGDRWRVGARVRGLSPESAAIGEREALAV